MTTAHNPTCSFLPNEEGYGKGINNMYIKPSIKVEEAQASQMLAESLKINTGTTVNGNQALTKEDNNWNIWGEE